MSSAGQVSGIYHRIDKPASRAKGRKDKNGQEKVITLDPLKEGGLDKLVKLYDDLKDAQTDFNEEIKAMAEKCGLLSSVVRSAVTAKASKDAAEAKKKAEQMSLVFDELAI